MEQMIPGFLEEMLKKQYGEEAFAKILAGYQARRPVTLRVNPLKADRNSVEQALTGAGIAFKNVSWYEDAMIIEGAREPEIQERPIYQEGGIYLQSLSSMLPPLFLGPKAGESVLDMAAAPGGKTTQMAAMTGNQAQITACEKNKARSEKLKYNLEKQGASGTYVMVEDARKLDDFFSFDRILLDAPCSGSGTVEVRDGVCRTKISKELVERSARTQEELLKKAKVDMSLRQKLFDTRNEKNPVSAFCKTCRELGYEIYDMDLISAGEEFYAAMRRSTNGGGENSPMLKGEDDFYELFFASLESL